MKCINTNCCKSYYFYTLNFIERLNIKKNTLINLDIICHISYETVVGYHFQIMFVKSFRITGVSKCSARSVTDAKETLQILHQFESTFLWSDMWIPNKVSVVKCLKQIIHGISFNWYFPYQLLFIVKHFIANFTLKLAVKVNQKIVVWNKVVFEQFFAVQTFVQFFLLSCSLCMCSD